ncbi:MAG: superfamily [Firmicutes bacterium]|nr:superfamily [Bacillota bacterium]
MYRLLCPEFIVESLFSIDFEQLKKREIKGIIFDLDNTIIPWDSLEMCPDICTWLERVREYGFKVSIVSNNWHERVKKIAFRLNLPYVARAYKPASYGFRKALAQMGLSAEETAIVGDQLFTDVLGGNRIGLCTIWVKPLTDKEFIGTRLQRYMERWVVKRLRGKGLLGKED